MEMPTLHYKYRMNEPFINGERGQYQVSHEQDQFKKRHVYGMQTDKNAADGVKTIQDELNEFKSEFNEQLLSAFDGRSAPDVHTLIVKQDQTDMFGLRITTRHCPKINQLFDFDIDEYISFQQMLQMLKLPAEAVYSWQKEQWSDYLKEKTVMELKIVESDTNNQGWAELACQMLNSFSQSVIVNTDPALCRTVLLNSTRGNQLYSNYDDPATTVTYLFMVNRSTEHLGQFLDSDFALLRQTTEIVGVSNRNSPQSKMSRALLEPCNANKTQQVLELEQEKQELEIRLKIATDQIQELTTNAETNDKIIKDKERQARSDKKQIEFLENDKKQVRGELRTC